jgi:hypothetical protein
VIIPSRHRGLAAVCGAAASIGGTIVAVHYHRLGLTLSHYDARAHLVVARRIVDSITPGWQQIGAVWLPLPHLLNMFPVQMDALYRSGASAVAISVAAFAVATAAIAWIAAEVMVCAGSEKTRPTSEFARPAFVERTFAGRVLSDPPSIAGVAAAMVFGLNPNVLYLQATPMTELLVIALMTVAVAIFIATLKRRATDVGVPYAGGLFALACLTRYEAWPVTASAVALTAWARRRQGAPMSAALHEAGRIAVLPAIAVIAFLIFSRIVIGQWFVSSGFFVPENKALGDPMLAAAEVVWGVRMLGTAPLLVLGVLGVVAVTAVSLARRERGHALVTLALAAVAALPWSAFLKGHPFRIRYMVMLLPLEAIAVGVAVGFVPRLRIAAAVAVVALAVYESSPLDVHAPMVVEAQWEQPNAAPRRGVTACLRGGYNGEVIMASMGSLGHYMQEAAADGFAIRDFLHEGNGDIWLAALDGPRPFVGWILIEEKANGGDMLARKARENPHFLDGFSRVCEGGGLALYERQNRKPIVKR